MLKKKAVLFDLWNTLIEKQGPNLTSAIAAYYSLSYESVYEWIRLSSLAKDKSDKYYYLKMICLANNIVFKDEDKMFFDSLVKNYHEECAWISGAKSVLLFLKEKNFKIGILSNTSEISYNVIENFRIKDYVDEIVLSCEEGYLKPDPRIFNCILEKLDVSVEESIMVGDKITTDILGAKTIGMDVIFYNPRERQSNYYPQVSFSSIINDLNDIKHILN